MISVNMYMMISGFFCFTLCVCFFSVKAHCCSLEAQLDDSRITVLLEHPVIFTKFQLIYKAESLVIFFK